jgi:hypothetical protein
MATVPSGPRSVTEPRPSRPFRAETSVTSATTVVGQGPGPPGILRRRSRASHPVRRMRVGPRVVSATRSPMAEEFPRRGRGCGGPRIAKVETIPGGVRRAETELQERDRLKHAGRLGEVQTVKVVKNGEGGTKRAWKPATRNRNHRGDSSRSGPSGTDRTAGPMPTSAATWISVRGAATGGILCQPALARPSSDRRRQSRPTGPGVVSPARGRRARFATGGSPGRQPNGETFAPNRRERAATLLGVPQGANDGSGRRNVRVSGSGRDGVPGGAVRKVALGSPEAQRRRPEPTTASAGIEDGRRGEGQAVRRGGTGRTSRSEKTDGTAVQRTGSWPRPDPPQKTTDSSAVGHGGPDHGHGKGRKTRHPRVAGGPVDLLVHGPRGSKLSVPVPGSELSLLGALKGRKTSREDVQGPNDPGWSGGSWTDAREPILEGGAKATRGNNPAGQQPGDTAGGKTSWPISKGRRRSRQAKATATVRGVYSESRLNSARGRASTRRRRGCRLRPAAGPTPSGRR